ncbi:hypothetical protein F4808DRAFT_460706 [Astrocystis sublimbata]|nr:hypothetical protein F4808DRAFT_460706 [Astrocystis sublimbata]
MVSQRTNQYPDPYPYSYPDSPPSYAEATGVAHHDFQTRPLSRRRASRSATVSNALVFSLAADDTDGATTSRMFPANFSLYRGRDSRHFFIGEVQHVPLFAVSSYSAIMAVPDLVISSGPTEDAAPMAFVESIPFSRSAGITLPTRHGSIFPSALELLESSASPVSRTMSFDIETLSPGGRREHFEWRHSSGPEVEALAVEIWQGRQGMYEHHSGWKLVRRVAAPLRAMPGGAGSVSWRQVTKSVRRRVSSVGHGHGHSRDQSHGQNHDDGREIVAAWVDGGMFMPRALRFQFLGSGADGGLGSRWAIMAVASALAIWNRRRRERERGRLASAGF